MKLPPASVLFSFPAPNYVNPQSQGPALIIVNSIFIGLATVVFILRIVTRLFVRKWIGLDDFFIAMAWVCTNPASLRLPNDLPCRSVQLQ